MRDYASRDFLKRQKVQPRRPSHPLLFDLLVCVGWYVLRKTEARRKISTEEWLERMRNLQYGLK